jgi:hypothetical protein
MHARLAKARSETDDMLQIDNDLVKRLCSMMKKMNGSRDGELIKTLPLSSLYKTTQRPPKHQVPRYQSLMTLWSHCHGKNNAKSPILGLDSDSSMNHLAKCPGFTRELTRPRPNPHLPHSPWHDNEI